MTVKIGDLVNQTCKAMYGHELVDVHEVVEVTEIINDRWAVGEVRESDDTRNPGLGRRSMVYIGA